MSLSNAKRVYTTKKNYLIRLLDRVPTLLYDQNVGTEKLEKAESGCTAAWDGFSAAHDKLIEIQSDEEAQEAEMEVREEEFGNLGVRFQDLLGNLADAMASRGRDQLRQENQVEAD